MSLCLSRRTGALAGRPRRTVSSRRAASTNSLADALFRVPAAPGVPQPDLDHAVRQVRAHDPSGYLPGRLLPSRTAAAAYYAARSLWVETGLRRGALGPLPPEAGPEDRLDWWQRGIDRVFAAPPGEPLPPELAHPTLRLLQALRNHRDVPWEQERFDTLLRGRRDDLTVLQYESLEDLERHARRSCANLLALVLESGGLTAAANPQAHRAAGLVGVTHGLTIALRTSIPVMSVTGKIIVPADLCRKYGVRSPRYLLSALGQGDTACVAALQRAVRDIALSAREHLQEARELRPQILQEPHGAHAVAALLPGLVSETFLNRLERVDYQLTNRDLRHVGLPEHAACVWNLIAAYSRKTY